MVQRLSVIAAAAMASNKKLEEKYQKVLKECQRRPENRSCFDCTSRGNQYVVLNFNTCAPTVDQSKISSALLFLPCCATLPPARSLPHARLPTRVSQRDLPWARAANAEALIPCH